MFAYKVHYPYEQTLSHGFNTEALRAKIGEVVVDWTMALDLCKVLDENWKVFEAQVKEENTRNSSSLWRQARVLIKGEPTLEGYELYVKHVCEFRSKIATFKDIHRIIVANLSFIENSNTTPRDAEDQTETAKTPFEAIVKNYEQICGSSAEETKLAPITAIDDNLKD